MTRYPQGYILLVCTSALICGWANIQRTREPNFQVSSMLMSLGLKGVAGLPVSNSGAWSVIQMRDKYEVLLDYAVHSEANVICHQVMGNSNDPTVSAFVFG